MQIDEAQIKSFLLDSNLLSRKDIEEASKESIERELHLQDVLVSRGMIEEDDLGRIEAYLLGIPFVDLTRERLDFSILSLIPEPISRNRNIIAYRKGPETIEVAMLDARDFESIKPVVQKSGLKFLPRLTDKKSMKSALVAYQAALKREFGDIIQNEISRHMAPVDKENESELKKLSKDKSISLVVDTLLKHALVQGASDIHIEPGESGILVRYRIGDFLHDAMVLPQSIEAGLTARIKSLSDMSIVLRDFPQDGRFKIDMNGESISFRVSTMPVQGGEKIVMRLLRENVSGFTLEGLGFHAQALADIHKAMRSRSGFIISSGPGQSGKTTVLYTLLDILNTPKVNISTIEDPIEYQMKRVNQTEVKPEIGFTYEKGMRSILKQDPDIIMVGEIRDKETLTMAANACLTGHLVLSSVYARSASEAVARMLDLKADPLLLSQALSIVISGRLIRKLDKNRTAYFLNKEEINSLGKLVSLDRMLALLKSEKIVDKDATWAEVPFYKPFISGEGQDGFEGYTGIYEVMNINSPMRDLINKGDIDLVEELDREARRAGDLSMVEDGIFKAVMGLTTIEEVLEVLAR